MENTVTMKLEDYDNMKENLKECREELRQIKRSITEFCKNKNGVYEKRLFGFDTIKTEKVSINIEQLLKALGIDSNVTVEIK